MAMKKLGLVVVAVLLIIVILVVGLFVYLGNPEPSISAMITDFEITGFDNNSNVGVAWDCMFTLIFLNNGTTDINNLTLTFSTNSTYPVSRTISGAINSSGTYSEGGRFTMGEQHAVGPIKVGEEKRFDGEIENDLADSKLLRGFTVIATLKSNDIFMRPSNDSDSVKSLASIKVI